MNQIYAQATKQMLISTDFKVRSQFMARELLLMR
jgi:hypothetical protein